MKMMSLQQHLAREELKQHIVELCAKKKWPEALVAERRLMAVYHEGCRRGIILSPAQRPFLKLEEEEEEEEEEMSGDSWHLRGLLCQESDPQEAYRCFTRGAELGFIYSRYLRGNALERGEGVARDVEAAVACYVACAEAGCPEAVYQVAVSYQLGAHGFRHSYFKAALWWSSDPCYTENLQRLLQNHPLECTPLGIWQPAYHHLVAPAISSCMFHAMLVCLRLGVHNNIATLIAGFVCTAGNWKLEGGEISGVKRG